MIEHLKQESTWRGFVALAIAAGVTIAPELQEAIIALGLTIIGLINVIKKD
jgi:hypothetical protein